MPEKSYRLLRIKRDLTGETHDMLYYVLNKMENFLINKSCHKLLRQKVLQNNCTIEYMAFSNKVKKPFY